MARSLETCLHQIAGTWHTAIHSRCLSQLDHFVCVHMGHSFHQQKIISTPELSRVPKVLLLFADVWWVLISIDQKEDEARFAVTFCGTGVVSGVHRLLSLVVNAHAIISLVFLLMYLQTLLLLNSIEFLTLDVTFE